MYQFFVSPFQVGEEEIVIEGSDVNHIRNVLRMRVGEEISVSDGAGKEYHCAILALEEDCVRARILDYNADSKELTASVTLFQALPKADKMELIVQKAVELGAVRIVPVETKRCVVKLDKKKAAAKQARWQGIAEAAAKQSKRSVIPEVSPVASFEEALSMAKAMDVCLIPYEEASGFSKTREAFSSIKKGQSVAVWIGPEGGFAETEVSRVISEADGVSVTLGKRILRTETAGLYVLSVLGYLLEE